MFSALNLNVEILFFHGLNSQMVLVVCAYVNKGVLLASLSNVKAITKTGLVISISWQVNGLWCESGDQSNSWKILVYAWLPFIRWSCVEERKIGTFNSDFSCFQASLPVYKLLYCWTFTSLCWQGDTVDSEYLSELTEEEYEVNFVKPHLKGFVKLDIKYLIPFFTRRFTKQVRKTRFLHYCRVAQHSHPLGS